MRKRGLWASMVVLLWAAALPRPTLAAPIGGRGSSIYDLRFGLMARLPAGRQVAGSRDGALPLDAMLAHGWVYDVGLGRPLDRPVALLCLLNTRDGFAFYRREADGVVAYGTSPPGQAVPTSLWCVIDLASKGDRRDSENWAIRPSEIPAPLWSRLNSRNGFEV